MTEINVRELSSTDVEEYFSLMKEFTEFTKDVPSLAEFQQDILDNQSRGLRTFVLKDITNQKIIGAGSVLIINKLHLHSKVALIEDVVISKHYRKKGHGLKLIQSLEDYIAKHSCYKIVLNCLVYNISFYQKCGYQKIGTEMRKYNLN